MDLLKTLRRNPSKLWFLELLVVNSWFWKWLRVKAHKLEQKPKFYISIGNSYSSEYLKRTSTIKDIVLSFPFSESFLSDCSLTEIKMNSDSLLCVLTGLSITTKMAAESENLKHSSWNLWGKSTKIPRWELLSYKLFVFM